MKNQPNLPKLSIPPLAVQDVAAQPVRYGDGFIQAGFPPMMKQGK